MNKFETNVAKFVTETGDNILYPFGPPIFQTEVDSNFTKELLEEGRKLNIKEDDHNFKLAGNLKYGRSYHYKEDYLLKVEPYLKTYVERYLNGLYSQYGSNYDQIRSLLSIQNKRREQRTGDLRLDTLWINFSQKHDYNPPHKHIGVLSFVLYCKVPSEIFEVQADSNDQKAGQIIFRFGDQISPLVGTEYSIRPYENLLLIFPAELIHTVSPYWVDTERVSVSGNFVVL